MEVGTLFRHRFLIPVLFSAVASRALFGGQPETQLTPPKAVLAQADDRTVWEAEWPNRMTGTFELLPSSHCSGQGALWVRDGTGRQNISPDPAEQNNPFVDLGVVDYYFEVPREGRYQVHMRLMATDKCGNSCWIAIDDLSPKATTYFPGGKRGLLGAINHNVWPESFFNRWIWATDETTHYSLTKGAHHMRIRVREDGFAIDQIAILPMRSKKPRKVLSPTQIPGSGGLPTGVSYSTTLCSTSKSLSPTPFDVFFTLMDSNVAGTPLSTEGFAWVRLNSHESTPVSLSIASGEGTVRPGSSFACELTPATPLLKIPLTFELPPDADRRSYPVTITGTSPRWPDLTITRSEPITHTLDWMVSAPMTYYRASSLLQAVLKSQPRSPNGLSPGAAFNSIRWTQAEARRHFNEFGAVDLTSLHGETSFKVAIAATWVSVKEDWRGAIYGAGDDTLLLYAGSDVILRDHLTRPLTDTLKLWPVSLSKGDHLLLAVIYQRQRGWEFQVDFRDAAAGEPSDAVIGRAWK